MSEDEAGSARKKGISLGEEIKSAYEKAMEKIANLEGPTPQQRLEWDGVPKGKKIAAVFLKGEGELAAVQATEPALRQYVVRGAVEVFAANMQLAKTPAQDLALQKSLDGLRFVLKGAPKLDDLLGRVKYVTDQYRTYGDQQRQQAFAQLKQQFQAQVQQAMQRQGQQANRAMNVETMPEFQAEWMRVRAQLDGQFEGHMDEFRQQLKALAK